MFEPRPKQRAILAYTGGKMGIAAVPGSGKTWTLSLLAAQLVATGDLSDDQEVLIVTLVNAAVRNFSARVSRFLQERYGLLPNLGYRVRTLHGLAHDIVRERPSLAGLSDDFGIIDESAAQRLLRETVFSWLHGHPEALESYLSPAIEDRHRDYVRREKLPDLVLSMAQSFIKQAKDLELPPPTLRYMLDHFPEPLPLMEMGVAIYADYQRALAYRGMVDFDDLIRLARAVLQRDPAYRERLRHRWPYILEDEAQDSSQLQERILRELCGEDGNWVRVGDPNQAIYETFTTANPRYLREFMRKPDVQAQDLPNSGRSTATIIALANELIRWTQHEHPIPALRDALAPPYIEPTPPGDPQPNPPDEPDGVRFIRRKYTPDEELREVIASVIRWLPQHPHDTVAILVPRNSRGAEVVSALRAQEIPYVELLRSSESTRQAAGALANVIAYLADPGSAKKLATVYRVWRRADRDDETRDKLVKQVAKLLRGVTHPETLLWPQVGEPPPGIAWPEDADIEEFLSLVRRWQEAALLPIDQLLLTLAQDLFTEPSDLAVAHKLALMLRQTSEQNPTWRLPQLTQELGAIARNKRKFLGFDDEDWGFDPDAHRGEVVVATIHKAKGLEWDKVYLMSVNDYNFPSAMPQDSYIAEKYYVRDSLNLEAELLSQMLALHENPDLFIYDEGTPTQLAREAYASERLRLFYVGITRARRELVITWNSGRRGDSQPAVVFLAMAGD